MNQKTLPVITISREYGAGGRTIAKGLAKKLGIEWYDRDFVKLIAKESGYSEEDIYEEGEELSEGARFLNSILNNITSYTSSHDAIYEAQKEAILALAQEKSCIIVGRCANLILQDAGIPSFDIFLYADKEIRVQRALEKQQMNRQGKAEGVPADVSKLLTPEEMQKYVTRKDEQRANYYKTYTHRDRNMAQEYTVCLDTGAIPYDTCIEALEMMIAKWKSIYTK